jgi:ATP-binding cassette subfamily B protein
VTGLLGDVMAAATTVKVNDAPSRCCAASSARRTPSPHRRTRPGARGGRDGVQPGRGRHRPRPRAARERRRDRLGCVRSRHLALFTAYLGWLSFLPRMVGRVLARRKQAGVAFDRMRRSSPTRRRRNTVRGQVLPIDPRDHRVRPPVMRPDRVRSNGPRRRGSHRQRTATGRCSTTCRSPCAVVSSW